MFANEPHYFFVSCFYKCTSSINFSSLSPLVKCVGCVHVFVILWLYVYSCVHTCGDWHVFSYLFLRQGLSLNLELKTWLDLQARKPQRSSCQSPQCCSYNVTLQLEFYVGGWTWIQVLVLVLQILYRLNHFPSPKFLIFNCAKSHISRDLSHIYHSIACMRMLKHISI